MEKIIKNLVGVIYASLMGIILGFIAWLFLFLVYIGINLFWNDFILKTNSKIIVLIVCIIGGVLVGLCEKYIGKYPKTMEIVFEEFKTTKSVEYKSLPKSMVKVFVILWFGATVGPEAAVTGLIGGLSTLVGEYLKFGFSKKEHDSIIIDSNLKSAFEIPLYGFYNFISKDDKVKVKKIKKILYGSIIVFALLAFMFLESLDSKASFITKFSKTIISVGELKFIIPLFIIGLLIVCYSTILDFIIKKVFEPLKKYKVLMAVIGGVIFGTIAICIPFILFSGEHTLGALIEKSSLLGPSLLIVIALFKLISSKICITTGWIGGPIFPIMFSAAAIGMAFSYSVGTNLSFSVAIVMSTAVAGILKNYKITTILLFFFFSFNVWIFILISAFLAEVISKKISKKIFSKKKLKML